MGALLFHGAKHVIGIEPDEERVKVGRRILQSAGLSDQGNLIHVHDTLSLPFEAERFDFVIANAVLEHIPMPRRQYLIEMWSSGGYLMINAPKSISQKRVTPRIFGSIIGFQNLRLIKELSTINAFQKKGRIGNIVGGGGWGT
jgi:2-polyprenyl-3-methyl-5-hydroxy-6-metoxy-1,4-benzoquinol methylase